MSVLAKGLNVPFMVEGEAAKQHLNKKPSKEQVVESKKIAENFAKNCTIKRG